ncbi:MAG: ATP-binding protein [Planctomycetota bacterium]
MSTETPHDSAAALKRAVLADSCGRFDWRISDDALWANAAAWELVGSPAIDATRGASEFFAGLSAETTKDFARQLDAVDREQAALLGRVGDEDGQRIEIRFRKTLDSAGRVTHLSGAIRDVEAQLVREEGAKAYQQRLQARAEQVAIDGLASGVAHEFNNVLQIVRGYITFAWQAAGDDSPLAEDLQQAIVATDRAADIATRLLRYARAEDDADVVTDVNEVIGDLSLLLSPIIGPEIEVGAACCVEPMRIAGVDASLRHAVLNLCVNARDAMAESGSLIIAAERFDAAIARPDIGAGLEPGAYCRVSVSDTGCGLPSDVRRAVFEPFFSTKGDRGGTGLGLAIVSQFVANAGGAVHVESRLDVGSCFSLFVPTVEAAHPLSPRGAGECVLVFDPDENVARAVGEVLNRAGYDAVVSPSERAFERAKEQELPALVIAACEHEQDIPSVRLVEGIGPTAQRAADADDEQVCVGKPFNEATLLEAVRRTLVAADRSLAERRTNQLPEPIEV